MIRQKGDKVRVKAGSHYLATGSEAEVVEVIAAVVRYRLRGKDESGETITQVLFEHEIEPEEKG